MRLELLTDNLSERQLLSGLMNDNDSYTNVHDLLSPGTFYTPEHEAIYGAFSATYRQGEPAPTMTLAIKSGVSPTLLLEISSDAVIGASRRTAERLVQLAQKRKIYRSLKEIVASLPELSVEDLAGKLTATAVDISLDSVAKRVLPMDKLIPRVAEIQAERHKEPGIIRGIRTGYVALDVTLRGLRPRRLTLLAAATGFGKSTIAINIFSNVVQSGVRSLLVSTENDIDDNLDRLCGITTGMELKEIEGGWQPERVANGFAERFKDKTGFISDNSPRNIHEVVGTIARYVLQHGVELVFVDYISEIAMDGAVRNETEEARLTRWSQTLLEAARTLNVHIIVLAQLNREGNRKGRPSKTDLQSCFKMAQKSHSLLIFWQTEQNQDVLTIDKNRQGAAKVDIALKFQRTTQRITELGFWLEAENRIVPPSNAPKNVSDYVDLDAGEPA